jgi:hypothetical protein
MLKFFVLNKMKKRFLLERKALDLILTREDIKEMPPNKVKMYNGLYSEITEKINAIDLLFRS